MPTTTTATYFYLGNHPDIDPDEDDFAAENASALLGTYSQPPLVTVTNHDMDDSGSIRDNEDNPAGDYASYDVGGGTTNQFADSTVYYQADVLLGDGSVQSMELMVIQMENGDVFLVDRSAPNSLDGLNIQSITLTAATNDNFGGYLTSNSIEGASTVCFVADTEIAKPGGSCRAMDIAVGTAVSTVDHGAQPCRSVFLRHLRRPAHNAPLRVPAVLFGGPASAAALRVSPQHRLLVRSPIVARMFGTQEVLIPARFLLAMPGVEQADPHTPVTYAHLLFDRHEALLANGIPSESLFTGAQAREVLGLGDNPTLRPMQPARPFVTGRRARRLIERHVRSAKPLGAAPSAAHPCMNAVSGKDAPEATRLVQ